MKNRVVPIDMQSRHIISTIFMKQQQKKNMSVLRGVFYLGLWKEDDSSVQNLPKKACNDLCHILMFLSMCSEMHDDIL